ncbi:hypothetical protein AGMMS49921_04390 [Endomicrobiia bacterium]|nr:hypothetical protein AGMMS49921_04390 [Endomicrobiia bacterium]
MDCCAIAGIKDPQAAKALIGKTALLEFRIVNTSQEASKVLALFKKKGITPSQYRENPSLYPDIETAMPEDGAIFESKEDKGMYYVLDKVLLTGAALINAKVGIGEFEQPAVSIEFNKDGGKVFADITEKN